MFALEIEGDQFKKVAKRKTEAIIAYGEIKTRQKGIYQLTVEGRIRVRRYPVYSN